MKCDGEYVHYLTGKHKIEFEAPRFAQKMGHIEL